MKPDADALAQRLDWQALDPIALRALIQSARAEDIEGHGLRRPPAFPFDVSTACIPHATQPTNARLTARNPLTLAGTPLVPIVLEVYGDDATFSPMASDGQSLAANATIGLLHGNPATILSAERVILNFLQHLSGIATRANAFVQAIGTSPTRILDTRKTTPGLRLLEKYAVACGGAFNHRLGLFDRIMLKDNHLAAAAAAAGQPLADLIRSARQRFPAIPIQVEVDALTQIPPALDAGVDAILLDNFSTAELHHAVALINHRALSEASGNVSLDSIPAIANIGLDFISTGAMVHKSTWVDIGLDW